MGFRRNPGDPLADPPSSPWEEARRLAAASLPAHPALEETEFPCLDVYETPGELVVEAELPGIDPARIGVTAGDGLVVIEGTKEDPGPGRVNYLCMERSFGLFRRVVLAGPAIDYARAAASYRDGVLQVRLPKVEEKRGLCRTIPVVADANPGTRSEP